MTSRAPGSAPPLVAIVGPTCTGKTRLAVDLALRLVPAELLNADSRQLRRGLRAGTCAPTPEELRGVPCHLLELADPGEPFTVADWLAAATDVVSQLEARGVLPIVVGGTGLYVSALIDGFDFGRARPDAVGRLERNRLAATDAGRARLTAELLRRDPVAGATVDLRNPRRVIRALEILDARGGSLQAARRTAPRPAILLGLDVSRDLHARLVEARTAAMFRGPILDEVRAALQAGVTAATLAGCGIGYAEAIDAVEGRLSVAAATAATVQRTLRYARAQRTYFRRDARIRWLAGGAAGWDALVDRAQDAVRVARSRGDG